MTGVQTCALPISGTQQGNQYNIYSIIEHEVDEILGTASCIGTQGSLSDTCSVTRGNGSTDAGVAAVDLFRYTATVSSTGAISNPSRAPFPTASVGYFSYTGGTTVDAFYNHTANGQDYSDFNSVGSGPMSSDPSYTCQYVQDAEGCLAGSPMITNDGNAEVTILDAVGFNTTASVTPEPGTMGLFGAGLALLTAVRLRRTRVKDTQR